MALATCERCEQLFDKIRSTVCPRCEPKEEADFEKVRDWLSKNTDQSAEEVAEGTGVSRECVLRLIEQGRITSVHVGDVWCGRCGAPAISATKRLCQRCLGELNQEFAKEQAKLKAAPKKDAEGGRISSMRAEMEKKRDE